MDEKLMDKIIKDEINKEDIVLPEAINLKLKDAYKIIEKQEVYNTNNYKKKKRNLIKKTAVASSLTIGFLGVAAINPAFAENIPGVSQLVKYLKQSYSYSDNIEKYADNINIVQNKNDMEVSLEGVIYDESSLKFIYTITSKEKLQWGVQMRNTSLKINGKELMNYKRNEDSSFVDSKKDREFNIEDIKIEDTADGGQKYAVINTYDISDLKLDDNIDIDWTLNEIHLQNGKYNNGPWDFKFKTSKEKLMVNSKVVDINYKYDIEGYKYTIDKALITPVEIKILSTTDENLYKDLYEVIEKIRNNSKAKELNGASNEEGVNKLIDGLDDTEESKELRERYYKLQNVEEKIRGLEGCAITDEKGNQLSLVNGKGSNGKQAMIYRPLKEMPRKLIFTPKNNQAIKDESEFQFYNSYKEFPIDKLKAGTELKQGKNMSILINSVERDKNNLKVNVAYKGDFKNSRFSHGTIALVPKNITIENKKGKNLYDIIDKISSMGNKNYVDIIDNLDSVDYYFNIDENTEYNVLVAKVEDGLFEIDKQVTIDIK